MRKNTELRAQIALMNENAALAWANARLVEQPRPLNRKDRKFEPCLEQTWAAARLDILSETSSTCAGSTSISEADESDADRKFVDQRR